MVVISICRFSIRCNNKSSGPSKIGRCTTYRACSRAESSSTPTCSNITMIPRQLHVTEPQDHLVDDACGYRGQHVPKVLLKQRDLLPHQHATMHNSRHAATWK